MDSNHIAVWGESTSSSNNHGLPVVVGIDISTSTYRKQNIPRIAMTTFI